MRRRLRIVRNFALIGALGTGAYGLGVSRGSLEAFAQGALSGCVISASLAWFEVFFVRSARGMWLQRLSFARFLALKAVIYAVVITLGLELGALTFRVPLSGPLEPGWPLVGTLVISLAFSLLANFVMQVNLMLGQGELTRFIRGRYHRPREEERIFLFLDLVGSTALAERIGGVRFLQLLNELYGEISGPILEHRGEIHKYVGDEVIVTWTPDKGLPEARCVRCALAIQALIETRGADYKARFDAVPAFRFALHMGRVVSGEIGSVKREIAYLGDPVNSTARILEACSEYGRSVIASGALLERLGPPSTFRAEPLGAVTLRGKETALPLFALAPS